MALARAQAASSLENIWLTVLSNVAIALSLALLLYVEEEGTLIFGWLGAAIGLGAIRAWWAAKMKAAGRAERDPRRVLRILTALAFASGLLWCTVPLSFHAFSGAQTADYIAFIVAGTTTGAIIQSLAYSPIAIAFGAPLMMATLYRLLMSGSDSGYVIAVDAVFLTLMLLRAAKLGERSFVASQVKASRQQSLRTLWPTRIVRSLTPIVHWNGSLAPTPSPDLPIEATFRKSLKQRVGTAKA